MANINHLYQDMNQDAALREKVFQYHFQDGEFNAPERQARMEFERALLDPRNRQALLGAYLHIYNQGLANQTSAGQPQARQQGQSSPYYRRAMGKAGLVTIVGLAALVLGTTIDDESQRHITQGLGTLLTAGGVIGGIWATIKDKYLR